MLGAAVVGYGNIGPSHANALKNLDIGHLAVICDIQKDRADRGAKEYGCRAVYDFDEVLKDDSIDVVHICTPHYLHKDMALKALATGKHVVLEKPPAMNKKELRELIEAYEQSDKKVCVMFQNRKNKAICALKEIVDDKRYGNLVTISGLMTWDRGADYYNADAWRGKWATEGGGLVINQSVHLLDLMVYLGGPVESVSASISTKRLSDVIEVEDTADALLFYENGMRGCFYATNAYGATTPQQLVLEFEQARIRYSDNFLYEIKNDEMPRIIAENDSSVLVNPSDKSCWGTGHGIVIAEFYEAITNGTNTFISLNQGIGASELLYSIYESAKNESKNVKLTD